MYVRSHFGSSHFGSSLQSFWLESFCLAHSVWVGGGRDRNVLLYFVRRLARHCGFWRGYGGDDYG